MNNQQVIRRTLAEAGMELPADRPIPQKLVDDLRSTHLPRGAGVATKAAATPAACELAGVCWRHRDGFYGFDRVRMLTTGIVVRVHEDGSTAPTLSQFDEESARHFEKQGSWVRCADERLCPREPEQPEPFCEATGPLPTTDPASRAIEAYNAFPAPLAASGEADSILTQIEECSNQLGKLNIIAAYAHQVEQRAMQRCADGILRQMRGGRP